MWKKSVILAGVFYGVVAGWGLQSLRAEVRPGGTEVVANGHVPGEVLVKFRDTPVKPAGRVLQGAAARALAEELPAPARLALAEVQGEVLAANTYLGLLRVRLRGGGSVAEAAAKLRGHFAVEYAQPNHLFRTLAAPNDPSFAKQWALNNTGQRIFVNFFMYIYGTPDADIDRLEAWNSYGETGQETVVTVIDTGVQYTHPDLANRMWKNSGEIAGNKADDDQNGYVDDVYGINTVPEPDTRTPLDDNGHGTHVAGIAAAQARNRTGIAGVAWNAKIMALKFLNSQGSGSEFDAVTCITYALNMKQARNIARMVMNASWGAYVNLNLPPFYVPPDPAGVTALYEAIKRAGEEHGALWVAAAGNDGVNIDQELYKMVPAGFDLPNIISVSGSDEDDDVSTPFWASNYGPVSVDLFAPGNEIYSTIPTNRYGFKSGTSMAAPQVSGALALVWGRYPQLHHLAVKERLLSRVDEGGVRGIITKGLCTSGGRLNVNKALNN